MATRQPFARRIVIAFVLMTALVSGIFSLGIVEAVRFVEERLVSEELGRELDAILEETVRNGQPLRLDSDTRFYASSLPEYSIPPRYRNLEEGFAEVEDGKIAYFAYTRLADGVRYVLVQEQGDFEAREHNVFNVVLAGFILSVLGALGLGLAMARRVMAPVRSLAEKVLQGNPPHPLAPEYADDEVGQLASAFDATVGELRQALEREQLFTSDVSHELRTPLMVIASSCELLAEAPLSPQQRAQVARIARAGEDMRELVQTFLHLARGKADQTDYSSRATLAEVAERQCVHWAPLIREKGLDFDCLAAGPDDGRYNPTLLGAVMGNLLRNALHYTDRGQVRLYLETGGFRVEDSGAGIPQEKREEIFLPFVRGATARGEGMGLGLSLVKRICAHQGWGIAVHHLPGGGSSFEVRLDQCLPPSGGGPAFLPQNEAKKP